MRAGVPTGAVPPSAAPVEHDLPAGRPSLARRHRPDVSTPGVFGVGFRTLIDLALVAVDGHVVVEFADARTLRFVPTSRGWLCTAGPHHALSVVDRTWHLALDVDDGRATARFDELGRLTAWTSEVGSIELRRDAHGRVVTLDDGGRRLHLDWTDDVISRAATEHGHVVTYRYRARHGRRPSPGTRPSARRCRLVLVVRQQRAAASSRCDRLTGSRPHVLLCQPFIRSSTCTTSPFASASVTSDATWSWRSTTNTSVPI
ncbi:MAG: hypothetical protein R2697_00735 [Ilumatobacteraceae bacterium]